MQDSRPIPALRPDERTGFILSRHWRDTPAGVEIELWVATDDGPVNLILPLQEAVAFVPQSEEARIHPLLQGERGMELRALDGLKVSADGVWENTLSPAVYLNKEATIGAVPDDANATEAPVWKKVNGTDHAQWHDHRIHWMGSAEPPVVAQDPHHDHLINDWRIPVHFGDTTATIEGTLAYHPGGLLGTYLTYGVIGLAALAILALQIVILRRRRATPTAPAG